MLGEFSVFKGHMHHQYLQYRSNFNFRTSSHVSLFVCLFFKRIKQFTTIRFLQTHNNVWLKVPKQELCINIDSIGNTAEGNHGCIKDVLL